MSMNANDKILRFRAAQTSFDPFWPSNKIPNPSNAGQILSYPEA